MVLRRFGLVAALLAAVCCGALLAGCANGDNDENDSDYEEKKALDYWNKNYDADDYKWEDITDDNRDKIVGTWKAVCEYTKEMYDIAIDDQKDDEKVAWFAAQIGFYTSMEFIIDASFEKCTFTFISDSSKCKTKRFYTDAQEKFPVEFVNGEGYKYSFDLDDKKYIATATAENLTLKQLAEVLHCKGFSISTTEDKLLLKNRPNDSQDLATWIFTGNDGEFDEESGRHCADYVIARVE